MKNLLFYLLISALFVSCKTEQLALTPTYNKGGYTFKVYKSKYLAAQDSIYIGGSVYDIVTKELLEGAVVNYGCNYYGDQLGNYSLITRPYSIGYPLVSRYVGYLNVETTPVIFQAGDSVRIDFYIAQDERPLIHCDGY
ncbi:hypothetical protein [Pontibacter fetidus]|uniref:Lipoprotein n=1 Tax=Pontibacter fetidus TaxID=2700082 RepID=A0A6B2H7R4_9BACT|nr:hypothetical protein [Pontibacter fetidus]NDK55164.1 hypothetical protein [Pontibacter fetidus]